MAFLAQDLIPRAGTAEERQNTRKILQKMKEATTQNNNDNRPNWSTCVALKNRSDVFGGAVGNQQRSNGKLSYLPRNSTFPPAVRAAGSNLLWPLWKLPIIVQSAVIGLCVLRVFLCLQFGQLSHIDSTRRWSAGFSSSSEPISWSWRQEIAQWMRFGLEKSNICWHWVGWLTYAATPVSVVA